MAAATTTHQMRTAPRSPAVESFLRNFERERQRLQEVLEVTLCYGVFCLSQNFSLKGMSVEELRAVTKYDAVKKRDFFVRNAGISARRGHADGLELSTAAQQQQLRVKPSHSWRDGNEDADILKPAASDARGGSHAETPAVTANRFLAETRALVAEKKSFDEIDFFTQLFGKQFIDTAWATFAGRNGSQIAVKSELDERFTRIDQRKLADKFPALDLPVASFVEFLSEYVKVCVGQHHPSTGNDKELEADVESALRRQQESDAVRSAVKPQSRQQRATMVRERSPLADSLKARPGRVVKKPQPTSDPKVFRPKSLQHVQSKIKPELDARRDRFLRVKTTQMQLMKESLARARLAEYEAKRMLDASAALPGSRGNLPQRVRKMALADITTGAAALEIADDFMKSPLLDSFSGKENRDDRNRANASSRKDPLREELYGAAPLDNSFLGCKPPRANTPVARKPHPKKPSRAYNGWLGDFGPQHTKTVVSEWETPTDDGDEDSDDAREAPPRNDQGRRTSSSEKFEWKFDGTDSTPPTRGSNSKATSQRKPSDDDFSSVYSGEATRLSRHDDDDAGEGFSDGGLSDASDPVFKWLKRAV